MTILNLNKEQTTVLSIILDHIGGSPSKSGRKYADEIRRMLAEQGFYHSLEDEDTYSVKVSDLTGIWFEETK